MRERRTTAIIVNPPAGVHPDMLEVEVVERKGRGHPDSICDALAEAFSIALTRAYVRCCGTILHHNVDKLLLAAGSSSPSFGGGVVTAPFDIFLAGRATSIANGVAIPVGDIAEESARNWLRANLHALEVERHVRIHTLVRPGSAALTSLIPSQQQTVSRANDTSFAVGYAPPSRLERIVLAIEQALTARETIAAHPMIGEDVKVMGIRRADRIDLTIACAMIDRHLGSKSDYLNATALVAELAAQSARQNDAQDVNVAVNTGDDLESERLYLTVSGTSAEAGDDGQTGRGNRVGGLITPCRPMTLEAAAGKNVVSHVGKSYSVLAHRIAGDLVGRCPEIADVTCVVVSRIGWPVDTPHLLELRIRTRDGLPLDAVRERAEAIAGEAVRRVTELPQLLLTHASVESPASWPGVLLF